MTSPRRRYWRGGAVLMALAAVVSPALVSVQAAGAAAPTSVTPGTVTPSSSIAGGSSPTYTVIFTTSGSGALGNGGTITLVGPDGTAFSPCPSSCGSSYALAASSGSATVASAAVSSVAGPGQNTVSSTTNQVILTLASSTIAAGDQVTATISSVENPVTAGSYKMAESTSSDTQPVDSPSYNITAGPPTQVIATGGDNQTTAAGTKFAGALTATVADIHGNPTTVPSSDKVSFVIGSTLGASATFSNSTGTELDAVGSNGLSTTSIPTANGTSGGPYAVTATLVDTSGVSPVPVSGVSTATFDLENGAAAPSPTPHVTPGTVTLSSHLEAATAVIYTIPFTTSPSGALPGGATITFVGPQGTVFPSCSPCAGSYSIAVTNSHAATISSVAASPATAGSTNDKIVVTLGLVSTIAAGDTVTITAPGVTNPINAAAADVISESTSKDTTPAPSPGYTIVHGPASKVVVISGGGQSAQTGKQFSAPLVVEVEDANGNGVPGEAVNFNVGSASGASATFANRTAAETDVTDTSTYLARTSFLTANGTAGGPYAVTATVTGVGSASFTGSTGPAASQGLRNTAGQVAPSVVTATPPTAGATSTYTFGFTTSATGAMPATGCPTDCTVTLVAPAGTTWPPAKSNGNNNYTLTAAGGTPLTVSGVLPNANQVVIQLGTGVSTDQLISFTVDGVTNPTAAASNDTLQESTFADNTVASSPAYQISPAAADAIASVSGGGQSAAPGATFSQPLSAKVADRFGNPVGGVTVTFTAPASLSAPTATFGGCPGSGSNTTTCVVTTGTDGVATTSPLTADSVQGPSYQVSATIPSGTTTTTSFALTNAQVLTPLPISVSPDTAGSNAAVYTVPLTTSGGGAIPASPTCPGSSGNSCEITLIAPNGTALPTSTGSYQVNVNNNHAVTLADVAVSSVAGPGAAGVSSTPNQAILSFEASSVGANDTVTVTISGVTNPSAAGSGYTFTESTSSDPGQMGSPSYSITSGTANSVAIVTGDNQGTTVGTAFPTPLEVNVVDAFGNPVSGEAVTFTAPASGASGSFPACPGSGSTTTSCVVSTDSQGDATSLPFTANSAAGSYQITVSATSASGTLSGPDVPSFDLTNLPPTMTIVSGTSPQNTKVGTAYPNDLQVQVVDTQSNPVAGVAVTFTAPATAPSGSFASCPGSGSTSTVCVETTNGSGFATASTFTANDQTGSFTVTASTPAASDQQFDLTNNPDSIFQSSPVGPVSQTATTGTLFGSALQVQILDRFGNPEPGVSVTFTTPASGPTATFDVCSGHGSTANICVVSTDSSGIATSNGLIANSLAGTYQPTAAVTGLPDVVFNLTNVHHGYWMVGSDGGIFNLGSAPFYGSHGGSPLNKPIVGMATAKGGNGYYLVASDGGIFAYGPGATYYGSHGGSPLNKPIVGMAVDPTSGGYWLVASDGGVFAYGAPFYGSHGDSPLNKPIVGMGAAPGGGYYLVASDGGIFTYGPGATYYGSHGSSPLNQPIVGMAVVPGGYYLVASDGGIFTYGSGATYYGSHGGSPLNQPIVGMALDPGNDGYWLVAKDGGIFTYGGAPFYGSEGSTHLNAPVVGMASSG